MMSWICLYNSFHMVQRIVTLYVNVFFDSNLPSAELFIYSAHMCSLHLTTCSILCTCLHRFFALLFRLANRVLHCIIFVFSIRLLIF